MNECTIFTIIMFCVTAFLVYIIIRQSEEINKADERIRELENKIYYAKFMKF